MTRLLATAPKVGDCTNPTLNASARRVCPAVAVLHGEAARSKRRAELQAIIAKHTDSATPTVAVGRADAGAASLATYLGAFGVRVSASKLSDWILIFPALALELGAALALVLVQAVGGAPSERKTTPTVELNAGRRAETRPAQPESPSKSVESVKTDQEPPQPPRGKRTCKPPEKPSGKRTKRNAKRKLGNVVRLIRESRGKITTSQQTMANRLRLSKTRTWELLRQLESAGHVKLATSREGTTVQLVA